MSASDPGFVHVFRPPATATAPVLLMLHGTGGDEHNLLPLADLIAPGAGVLSPRGKVLENGMPRFFRRVAEGVFDQEDLTRRTIELGDFVAAAAVQYHFEPARVTAVGFSNGANVASSLLLRRPGLLGRAVLIRAMVPFVPDPLPALPATPVLISNGRQDPLVATEETERLADLLRRSGADVTLVWQPSGHDLTQRDVDTTQQWLKSASSLSR